MNVIDNVIQSREQILELVAKHGVTSLKLYGSVLARKETVQSDIDFLAIFAPSLSYEWDTRFKVQADLEAFFNRRVGIVDARRIPDVFRPSIDTEPVDIMELSSDKYYSIIPKTSKLYYIMLDKMFQEYSFIDLEIDHYYYEDSIYSIVAEKLSWWFSRLLRLSDNDLKEYNGFYYVEVLYLCDKLSGITLWDYTKEDMERFKELLEEIKKYVQLRLQA
jgi:predicted nucleotidyltransferase